MTWPRRIFSFVSVASARSSGFAPVRPEEAMGTLRELFSWCRNDIHRPPAVIEFEQIAIRGSAIERYATVESLIEVLQRVDREAPAHVLDDKDAILLELLEHYQKGQFRRLVSNILIVSFSRRIAALAYKYCRPNGNDETTSRLVGALLETAAHYPLARRRSKVSANIAWETEKLLSRRLVRERRQRQVEEEHAAEDSDLEASACFAFLDGDGHRPLPDADAAAALSRFEEMGLLDRLERELIETTILYGWKLRECISVGLWRSTGLSYNAAHHRLTRSLKRIRNCVEADAVSASDFGRQKKSERK